MTDRVRHLTVTLDEDIRDDDLIAVVSAINRLRGVADVLLHVVTAQDLLARQVVRAEVKRQLHEAIDGVFRQRELREKFKEP